MSCLFLANWSCQSTLLAVLTGLASSVLLMQVREQGMFRKRGTFTLARILPWKKINNRSIWDPIQGNFIVRATRSHESTNHTIFLKFFKLSSLADFSWSFYMSTTSVNSEQKWTSIVSTLCYLYL